MKSLGFLLLILLSIACDPYGFGFKKNPAYVLDEAFKAVNHLDEESFIEVTGKEVLCTYANQKGIAYLKDKLQINPENVKLEPKVLNSKYHSVPQFVDFWSYYSERYQIDIQDKRTGKTLITAIVDCEYGTDGERNPALVQQKPKKYKIKECRLTKVIPVSFENLPIPAKCHSLKSEL